jgi:hypothetical protein
MDLAKTNSRFLTPREHALKINFTLYLKLAVLTRKIQTERYIFF